MRRKSNVARRRFGDDLRLRQRYPGSDHHRVEPVLGAAADPVGVCAHACVQLLRQLFGGGQHRHRGRSNAGKREQVARDLNGLDGARVAGHQVDVESEPLEIATGEECSHGEAQRTPVALARSGLPSPMVNANPSSRSHSSTAARNSSNAAGSRRRFASTSLVARTCCPVRQISEPPALSAQPVKGGGHEARQETGERRFLAQTVERDAIGPGQPLEALLQRAAQRTCIAIAAPSWQ